MLLTATAFALTTATGAPGASSRNVRHVASDEPVRSEAENGSTSATSGVRIGNRLIVSSGNMSVFEALATAAPSLLLELISSGELPATQLTFAAEHAGRIDDPDRVVPSLLPLLSHEKAYVREGALYGIQEWADRPDVAAALRKLTEDPEEEIRAIVTSIIGG